MLQIEELAIRRSPRYRIRLPQLQLGPGEVVALTGSSGCGKSTVLEMLGLILQPEQVGRYRLGADPVLDVAALLQADDQARLADVRARHLGFMLQSGGLLPFLSVRQNIELPRRMLGLPPRSPQLEQAVEILELQPLLAHKPARLSIGERQRVAFVRAIAHQPSLLLADEPTAALDPVHARRLFQLIIRLAREWQIAAVLVSHDWALVDSCAIRSLQAQPDPESSGTVFVDAA